MSTILLQARTNSSRLPAKILLPIGGIPLVVLATQRAANTGRSVIVVTSQESSDDLLCNVLSRWKIPFFRGELDNTLKRFVDALDEKNDDEIVVRLTGDNVFPDGKFIDDIIEDFNRQNKAYLCCSGEVSGLPYGVSAEVTRVGYLRQALIESDSAFDQEHVTPWIRRHFGINYYTFYSHREMGLYRCTIDTLDDYLSIASLFENIDNPVELPMDVLLDKLQLKNEDFAVKVPASRLVLGTAQFGLPYGITNHSGQPEQKLVNNIVRTAIRNGVFYIDTARAYGTSEQAIGAALSGGLSSQVKIITKLSPLDDCPLDANYETVRAFTERSIYQSIHALRKERLDVLMLHRASHLSAWEGTVWNILCEFKNKRLIHELGVSVQTPEEAMQALANENVSYIQLPFNILDYRWQKVIQLIQHIKEKRPLVIHVRSALLQGLLTTDNSSLWHRAHCEEPGEVIQWLKCLANKYSNDDVTELCLRFVISQPWIDGVVVGVETQEQLVRNLIVSTKNSFSPQELASLSNNNFTINEKTLNPSLWRPSHV